MDEKDKKIAELEAKCADYQKQLDELKGKSVKMSELETQNKTLSEQVTKLTEKVDAADKATEAARKETAFNVLLSEGKACAAQKDAYMKGDMAEFAKLAQPINLAEKGAGTGTGASGNGGESAEDKIFKLAEEKMKADKSLDKSKAVSLVLSENAELRKQYEAE